MSIPTKWFQSAKTLEEALVLLQQVGPHISSAAARSKSLLVLNNKILATDKDPEQVQLGTIEAAKPILLANKEFLQGPLKTGLLALIATIDESCATIDTLLDDQQQ